MNGNGKVQRWEAFLWPVIAAGLCLALWHYTVIWSDTKVFPAPQEVARALAELARKKVLWIYAGDSLRRVGLGFGLAAVFGIPLGLTLGWYKAANEVLNPVLQFLRPISPIAWIPIAIILFGVGDSAATFLIFIGAFFPIVVSCVDSVSNVPAVFQLVGRNFGLTPAHFVRRVIFPAALPQILVGLRLALGIAWLVVVAAEMIAVDSGLGYLVVDSRNAGKRYDLVLAAMLLIGVIGLGLDTIFRRLEKMKSVQWGFRDAA